MAYLTASYLAPQASGTLLQVDFQSGQFPRWDDYRAGGPLTVTGINLVAGRELTVRIIGTGTAQTIAYPTGWAVMPSGAANVVPANKSALLTVQCWGTRADQGDVICRYAVQG